MSGSIIKAKRFIRKKQRQMHDLVSGTCAVLLYHRITDIPTDPQLLAVHPDNFNRHLATLKAEYNLLTIDEFKDHLLNKKKFPKNSVVITFDDGYADNYIEALPLLKTYNAQALFYIATGTLNTSTEFWWDAVERIILLSTAQPTEKTLTIGERTFSLYVNDKDAALKLYDSLLPVLRNMPSYERETYIARLAKLFNSETGRLSHRAMTFDELKKMHASSNAVIGAHTHLHPSLGALNYEQQLIEIKESKDILEKILQTTITHFSYPFGTSHDYNNHTLDICRSLQFQLVAANIPELVRHESDPLQFPRFLVRNWDEKEFHSHMKQIFQA
ncbi:MAG: polysaccharide deacetylase family protein [Bacteroidota bacterium]